MWASSDIKIRIFTLHTLFLYTLVFQTTQRGSWRVAEAGRSRTRPSSTCPSSPLTASRPAPARWPSACAAATWRATSCRATQRRTVCRRASAEERSSPSWPASLSCWVSYDTLLGGCVERRQRPVVIFDLEQCQLKLVLGSSLVALSRSYNTVTFQIINFKWFSLVKKMKKFFRAAKKLAF